MKASVRRYPCDICGKVFYSKTEVKTNIKMIYLGFYCTHSLFLLLYICFCRAGQKAY